MALAGCDRCGKLFNKTDRGICPKCEPDEEADYEKVRQILLESSGMTAEELSAVAEVPMDCVLRFLNEGRIEHVQASGSVRCGKCGAPAISLSKKLCQQCLAELNSQVATEKARIKLPKKRPLAGQPLPGAIEERKNQYRGSRG